MKRNPLFCRGAAWLCSLALLVSHGGGLAVSVETVHADIFNGNGWIQVDGVPALLLNEQGYSVYPLSYQGSIYIPLRSAGEWMGATVTWEPDTQTVSLTTGGEPRLLDRYLDQKLAISAHDTLSEEEWDAWCDQSTFEVLNGVAATLRPDLTVQVDGTPLTFQNANGEPVYPIVFRDVTYLPVRSIGELLEKKVLWVPDIWPKMESNFWDYERLISPAPLLQLKTVYLYDPPTQAQLDAVQTYIDEVTRIHREMVEAVANFLVSEPMNQAETVAALEHICSYAEQIRQLPSPQAPFFADHIRMLNMSVDHLSVHSLTNCIQRVKDGTRDFAFLVQDDFVGYAASFPLTEVWKHIPGMQALLDQVRSNGF